MLKDSERLRLDVCRRVFKVPAHIPIVQTDKYIIRLEFKHKDSWTKYLVRMATDREARITSNG